MADSPILSGPRDPSGRPYALVWADSFSQTLDDAGARAVVDVLEANGFAPIVAPDACCGLTWITTGQLTGAKKHLASLLGVLAPFAASGIPIVGVEPSCTAVLRDDLMDLLPDDPRSLLVSSATRTLAEVLSALPASARCLPSLEGVEIVAQPHCHHYSVMGWDADQALLESLGARITRLEGCCGLAGNFGMEAGHYDLSVAVASHSLLPSLSAQPDAVYLADGFSCRTQAAQLGAKLAHPGAGAMTDFERACDDAVTAYLASERRVPFGEEPVVLVGVTHSAEWIVLVMSLKFTKILVLISLPMFRQWNNMAIE